ncbi:DNA polymerase I [Porcipelethomonas sp.]|uniref:DNA polymerase I n=1 Tax=Porcipelethomonas sp. TaxID=2981675 RepID=UPI003EF9B2BB
MKLLAVDGNSIMNRAYYGIRALTNKKGVYTNAILGFMNIYFKNFDEVKPECAAVAFDLRTPTFRHKAVASYKATRKGMPEELAMQMPLIKEILTAMGIKVIECEGYEADDVLGTLSKHCADSGNECFILTGDRDSLQLVNDKVTVRLATTKETIVYTPEKFREDYGFEPINLIDLKALMGDSSDNISGVAGIGQKTATTLVTQWTTVENLYEHLDEAQITKGVKAKLENGREAAEESKWLATICLDAPIDNDTESYKISQPDNEALSEILTELEMSKLLQKMNLKPSEKKLEENTVKAKEITVIQKDLDADTLKRLSENENLDCLYCDGIFQIYEEMDGEHTVYTTENKEYITELLSGDTEKYTFGAKPMYRLCFEENKSLKNISFDAEIAAYLLDPSSSEYSIEKLCLRYDSPYYSSAGEWADIASLPELCVVLKKEIDSQGMTELMYGIEQPLTEVLASMEHTGVKVNVDGVKAFGKQLKDEIEGLESQIYFMCGKEFNIASPKQLGDILYEMGLPLKKKNKNGFSTSAEILEGLRDKHPVIDLVLRYRQLTKLNSTYVEGLLKTVAPDGRIHTVFKQTETRTGRISSTEPNLQNIPVRTELGREMRKFFVAQPGKTLLDADYSQIELRIVAHICSDPTMIKGFCEGADIHTSTAAQVFGLPEEMVTPEMRSAAKAVNFGIIYGIGAFSLSKDINVSVYEAKKYISDYLHNFPNVEKFMNDTVERAKKDGYVTTMFGRKRYVPELSASNKNMQAAGRRIAMNTPVQGSAADIIKIAMVKVYRRLKEEVPDAKLILQVHDELIVECSRDDADAAGKILSEEMTNACELKVPLTADVNRGDSWYDAKG